MDVGELIQPVTDDDEVHFLFMDSLEILDHRPIGIMDHEAQGCRLACLDRGRIGLNHELPARHAHVVPWACVAGFLVVAMG